MNKSNSTGYGTLLVSGIIALAFFVGVLSAGSAIRHQSAGLSVALAIGALYLAGQFFVLHYLSSLFKERKILELWSRTLDLGKKLEYPHSISERLIQRVRDRSKNKQSLDSTSLISNLLHVDQGKLNYPDNFKHLVLLLGLFGTILGVTFALAQGGMALRSNVDAFGEMVPRVQLMFSTTMAGIAAYMGLLLTLMIARQRQRHFFTELEIFLQDKVLPFYAWRDDKHWDELLSNTEGLKSLPKQISEGFQSHQTLLAAWSEDIRKSLHSASEALEKSGSNISKKVEEAFVSGLSRLENEVSRAAETVLDKAGQRLEARIESGFKAPAEAWAENVNKAGQLVEAAKSQGIDTLESLQAAGRTWSQEFVSASQSMLNSIHELQTAQAAQMEESALISQQTRSESEQSWKNMREEFSSALQIQAESQVNSQEEQSKHLLQEFVNQWKQSAEGMIHDLSLKSQELSQVAGKLMGDLGDAWVERSAEWMTGLAQQHSQWAESAAKTLIEQSSSANELQQNLASVSTALTHSGEQFESASHLLQSNQAELQANISMLNSGLQSLLEKVEQKDEAGEAENRFLQQLQETLTMFQERAGDVLVENALKTQEILLEVLSRSSGEKSPVEGAF